MKKINRIKSISAAAVLSLAVAAPASALVLTADYTDASVAGGIYQTATGQLQSGPGGGATDVTATFKANVAAAFTYLQNSIQVAWNHVVTFKLATLVGADGDSLITSEDVNLRPDASTIRFDNSAVRHFFVDPTPFDNS